MSELCELPNTPKRSSPEYPRAMALPAVRAASSFSRTSSASR